MNFKDYYSQTSDESRMQFGKMRNDKTSRYFVVSFASVVPS